MMWIIHLVALVFFFPMLLITIPLHIFMNMVGANNDKTSQ